MTKKLNETIAQAVRNLGGPSDIALGSRSAPARGDMIEEWQTKLLERLKREAEMHKRMLRVLLFACLVLFAIGLVLLFYHRGDAGMSRIVFGGGALAGMIAVLDIARRVLIDKASYDMLFTMLLVLPPDQAVAAVKNLYYTQEAKK
jgi:hypothetical protein